MQEFKSGITQILKSNISGYFIYLFWIGIDKLSLKILHILLFCHLFVSQLISSQTIKCSKFSNLMGRNFYLLFVCVCVCVCVWCWGSNSGPGCTRQAHYHWRHPQPCILQFLKAHISWNIYNHWIVPYRLRFLKLLLFSTFIKLLSWNSFHNLISYLPQITFS
jgi:hypothetical protein